MDTFILALMAKNDKLKATSLYQVLLGKRTSSTLCYAFFHDILPYFGIFPKLTKKEWVHCLQMLKEQRAIQEDTTGHLSLGQVDKLQYRQIIERYPHINYARFGKWEEQGWALVQYFIQIVSCPVTPSYLVAATPFYTETVRQVTQQFPKTVLAERLSSELVEVFSTIEPANATNLARTLSGGEHLGETFYQVFASIPSEILRKLEQAECQHQFYQFFLDKPETMLYQLLKKWYYAGLNQSLLATRQLFLTGKNSIQIAQLRQLKESTIRDHLIEWALFDAHFPFDRFDFTKIETAVAPLNLPVWELPFSEFNQLGAADFLMVRLYQIKRKRETDVSR